MSILKAAAAAIRAGGLAAAPAGAPAPAIEPARRKRPPEPASSDAWRWVDESAGLVRLRRSWSADGRQLIESVFRQVGSGVPEYVEWRPDLYRKLNDRRGDRFELVAFVRPAWPDSVPWPAPGQDAGLPFCFHCGGRLFWRSIDGAESCAICRPPRLDAGFRELFDSFFLRAGVRSFFGDRSPVDMDF